MKNYDYLVNIIKGLGFEIYLQDNSSKYFSAYRIIIPGMSEIGRVEEIPNIEGPFYYNFILYDCFSKKKITVEMIDHLVNFFAARSSLDKEIAINYPILSMKKNGKKSPRTKLFEYFNIEYLLLGKIEKSYQLLEKCNKYCSENDIYICLMIMERMVINGEVIINDKATIDSILGKLFDKKYIDQAYYALTNPKSIYELGYDINVNYFYNNRKELYNKLYGIK